jgi:exodeoxyribonuclease VII small subunit
MAKKHSYTEAVAEVENIIKVIESEDLNIDQLSENIKKAAVLLHSCHEKLREAEADIQKILNEI